MRSGETTFFQNNKQMLLYFLRGSKRYFAVGVVSACFLALFEMINPRVIGFTVDSIVGEEPFDLPFFFSDALYALGGREYLRERLWIIALFVVVCAALNAMWRCLYRVNNARGAARLLKTMQDDLYGHIIRLPFQWHGAHQTGDIIQRCTSDVDTVKKFISEQFVVLLRLVVWIAFAIVFMWRIHIPLTLVVVAFLPVIIGNSLFYHKKIAVAFLKSDEEEGRLSAIAQENLTGVRVVRAFGKERYEKNRFEAQSANLYRADIALGRLFVVFWSISSFISRFQIFLIMLIGALLCVRGGMTSGHYLEFIGYNTMISWPVRMLGRVISEMSKAGVSIDRIRYIMNAREETDDDRAADAPLSGDIVFNRVSFSFDDGAKALDDVSFTIPAGKTFGVLGATGAGKSTLMYLLTRLYDLPEGCGRITVGGKDIREVRRAHVRERIGMVLQEPYLFSGTIEENITIAKKDAKPSELKRAVGTAALTRTIEGFADGFHTRVGERGVTLSGGQKQRAAIAQMLIRDPDVMIFDDSLSAVDTKTDEEIRRALSDDTKGATVILISHRLTTLMRADHILVLDKGRVAEEGAHEELLQKQGIYKKIYDLQTQGAQAF